MVIKVDRLVKRYEDKIALDHFDMEVKSGDIVGLLGPNGCGKTTAINCILGLLRYDKGSIRVFGEELKADSYQIKKRIGMVPQDVVVFYNFTVYENIDYFCGLYIRDKKLRQKYIDEAIDFVGLEKYKNTLARKLSGGLKRRLNIACGISHKPDLIFLDEPTVAVDAQSRNFILDGIRQLNRDGATIVYTTHYLEEVEKIASKIIIMDNGQNLVDGTFKELRNSISTSEKVVLVLEDNYRELTEDLKRLERVKEVVFESNTYTIYFEKGYNNLSSLIAFIESKGLVYETIYSQPPSLNDVFLQLTGKELRD